MGLYVVVAYRPRRGKEPQLLDAVRDHLPVLRSQGLATDRPPYVMRSADGTIVEVFEWRSADAVEEAHQNEVVKTLWSRFEDACEYVKLCDVKECGDLFAHFEPVDL